MLALCVGLLFFFSVIRRPPRSTLFPYRTLSRSGRSVLDGECCEVGIGYDVAAGTHGPAQRGEDVPVSRTGSERHRGWCRQDRIAEGQRGIRRGGFAIDPMVGADPYERREHRLADAHRCRTSEVLPEPVAVPSVEGTLRAVGVEENIDGSEQGGRRWPGPPSPAGLCCPRGGPRAAGRAPRREGGRAAPGRAAGCPGGRGGRSGTPPAIGSTPIARR